MAKIKSISQSLWRPQGYQRKGPFIQLDQGAARRYSPEPPVLSAHRLDKPVVSILSPIEHIDGLRLAVSEEHEFAAGELELHHCLFHVHGLSIHLLGLDHLRALLLESFLLPQDARLHLSPGAAVALALPKPAPVLFDLGLQLVNHHVDG